jgi:hypothetical protein
VVDFPDKRLSQGCQELIGRDARFGQAGRGQDHDEFVASLAGQVV